MSLRKTLRSGKTAFIPFIVAGDPDMAATEEILRGLAAAGADAVELGVPFSDPVADGVTVQKASERALASGTTLRGVLDLVLRVRAGGVTLPICLFTYLNPVFRMGYAAFAKEARAAGADGALIVDLPPEEAGEYLSAAKAAGLETVFLCSPTTTAERLKLVDESSTGFVYYVAREGVTGARAELPETLSQKLEALKAALKNPVAVGFGISTRAHVVQISGKAAGVVVGSALVREVENNLANGAQAVLKKVREMTE